MAEAEEPASAGEDEEPAPAAENEPAEEPQEEADSEEPASDALAANTLVLGDETIELDAPVCNFMERGIGSMEIELTLEATGVTAAGEDITLSFSRFAEESTPSGDAVDVTFGDLASPDNTFSALTDIGTVTVDGESSASASGVVLTDDGGIDAAVSFNITC